MKVKASSAITYPFSRRSQNENPPITHVAGPPPCFGAFKTEARRKAQERRGKGLRPPAAEIESTVDLCRSHGSSGGF